MNQEEQGNQPPIAEGPLRLQDVEHYLQANGILQAQQPNYERLDQVELAANVNAQDQYQTDVIQKFMQEDEDSNIVKKDFQKKKKNVLNKCRDVSISIQTAQDVLHHVSLHDLVDQCDTFYTLASSDHWSSLMEEDYIFSLEQFDTSPVKQFLSIIDSSSSASRTTVQELTNQNIIECCYIAHFLQSSDVLTSIVDIIQSSIDSENCTSICVLADELQIPSLLQSSMKFVMGSLEQIQANGDVWNNIPSALKNHILTLRNAAQSSIVGRGQIRQVLFSSADEFLAIFHDTLTLNKERLREAKQRQAEIIEERKMGVDTRRLAVVSVEPRDIYGGSVRDAAVKIEKQEQRLQALVSFYNEQKAIFAKDAEIGGRFKGSFSL